MKTKNDERAQTETPEQTIAEHAIERLIAGELQQIVIIGNDERRKTRMATAAANELGGEILSMYEIGARIRQSYSARATKTELEIVNELAGIPMLAIDTTGKAKIDDSELGWLSYIIDMRHALMLPTIIISDKHARKNCQLDGCQDCMENFLGGYIISRLAERGAILRLSQKD
jgi:hypothetical protein